jgi:hypothetical protein
MVEKTTPDSDYTSWKIIGNGTTIYLSLDAVNGENLLSLLGAAINGINGNASGSVKAIQPKHDRDYAG